MFATDVEDHRGLSLQPQHIWQHTPRVLRQHVSDKGSYTPFKGADVNQSDNQL